MPKFKNLKIRDKLIVTQLFTAFIALALFTTFFILNDIKIYRQSIINRVTSLGQILGANTASTIVFLDPVSAERILSSLDDEKYLVNAWLQDNNGEIFASYAKSGYKNYKPPIINDESSEFKDNFFILTKKIIQENEYIGMVSLRFNLYPLQEMTNNNIKVALIVFFIALLIVLGLSVITQKTISLPILKLADAAKKVSTTRDFSIRIEKSSDDEVGFLYDKFNAMLEQIHLYETERKKAQESLLKSEEKYRNIFNQGVMGIFQSTMDGKFISANPMMAQMIGFNSPKQLIESTNDIAKQYYKYPERRNKLIDAAINSNGLIKFENEYFRKDGSTWIANMNIRMVKDEDNNPLYLEGFIEDITEQKKAEDELKKTRAYAQNIINSSLDMIVSVNKDRKIVEFNKAACDTFGYERNEIIGQSILKLYANQNEAAKIGEQITKHGKYSGEVQNVRKNGQIFTSILSASILVDENSNTIGTVGNSRDITESKKAEEELRKHREHLEDLVEERTAELEVAKAKAEESDRLKSAFLATMSHELRTPLNAIIGFTGILLQGLAGPLNDEQNKQLNMVKSSSHHLLDLINDVLDISKIEAGQLDLSSEPFYIPKVIEKAIETITPIAQKKGLELNVEIHSDVGEITGDRRRVEQILINLLNNAVKFTEKGKVTLSCYIEEGFQVTKVSDTGIGIKNEDMGKLFKSFQQIDSGTTRYHEGTGLGLSICKKLVEMMHGEIYVESEFGFGSSFSFKLPIS